MTRLERAQRRAAALLLRWEAGESQGTIAKELGITRQRVNQIISYAKLARDLTTTKWDIVPSAFGPVAVSNDGTVPTCNGGPLQCGTGGKCDKCAPIPNSED